MSENRFKVDVAMRPIYLHAVIEDCERLLGEMAPSKAEDFYDRLSKTTKKEVEDVSPQATLDEAKTQIENHEEEETQKQEQIDDSVTTYKFTPDGCFDQSGNEVVDSRGLKFNVRIHSQAKVPFYGTGPKKGQWKTRKGVSNELVAEEEAKDTGTTPPPPPPPKAETETPTPPPPPPAKPETPANGTGTSSADLALRMNKITRNGVMTQTELDQMAQSLGVNVARELIGSEKMDEFMQILDTVDPR